MTEGDYTNIKITTPEDIAIAEILLLAKRRRHKWKTSHFALDTAMTSPSGGGQKADYERRRDPL